MHELIQSIVQHLAEFGTGAYVIVALVVFLETIILIGNFILGGSFLLIVGFFCYLQVFDLSAMLLVSWGAHFAGELVNYHIGRSRGRALFSAENKYLKLSFLEAAERRFASGGFKIFLFAQFAGFLRPIISVVAGAAHYSFPRYLLLMGVASSAWTTLHLILGFFFGASYEQLSQSIQSISILVLTVIVIFMLSGWITRQLADFVTAIGIWLEGINHKVRRSSHYQNIAGRAPRFFRFLENRISLSRPWGIGASFGWFTSFVLLALAIVIFVQVNRLSDWVMFDASLANLTAQVANSATGQVLSFFSRFAGMPMIYCGVLAALLAWRARQIRTFLILLGAPLVVMVVCTIWARIPVWDFPVLPHPRGRFPNLSIAVATSLLCAIYYWLWMHPGPLRLRKSLGFVVLTATFLVGFAEVYLGHSYPSDVLAAILVGLAGLVFTATVARNIPGIPDEPRRADLRAIIVILMAIAGAILTPAPHFGKGIANGVARGKLNTETTGSLFQLSPREAESIVGSTRFPINVLVEGPIHQIPKRLTAQGWATVQPDGFFTRDIGSPLFPAFVAGKPAAITMQKRDGKKRLVLRLWHLDKEVSGTDGWVGSVLTQEQKRKFPGYIGFGGSPDIDLALEAFAQYLGGFATETIPGFRERALYPGKPPYFTHGAVLVIRTDDAPE
ncbi:MAG: VTT domain-containing protein [Candidatus Sumerlaeaceae bacterium]|nr:VTT domain-containing protein [Candidatus Sumerlaeaceae bacterium]